jgi:AcrR family transcriptional regulator
MVDVGGTDGGRRTALEAMRERVARIVETAVDLAEQGGFENVRLREVAAASGVALGTLYRHFRSKEDLLLAALAREMAELERRMQERPIAGTDPLERVTQFFRVATRAFCRRPNLARAALRAVASGDHELTEKVSRFHDNLVALTVDALRGGPARAEEERAEASAREDAIADVLQNVWFSALVGWGGGLHGQNVVVDKVRAAAELVLRA